MKRVRIVQAALLLAVVALISSCSSGRNYQSYPPPPSASVSLIINGGPGYVINRYPDGRYYYRNSSGWIYWRGPGNRYYLDRRYINRSYYRHNQYRDWRRGYGRR